MATDERIWWVDDSGALELTDLADYAVLEGQQGLLMPPLEMSEEVAAGRHGARLRNVRAGVRVVDLPLWLEGDDEADLLTLRRALAGRLDPTREGRLRVQAADGNQRELYCRYSGGLEGGVQRTPSLMRCVLTFRAHDPFFYAASVVSTSWGLVACTFGWFPFFPLRLWSSAYFGDPVIVNAGDVEAWPQWTVTGPGRNLALRNLTTGEALVLATTLLASQTLAIDTRPYYGTITHSVDGRLAIPSGSSLWPLAKGNNSLRIELSGATVDSDVRLSYYPRYWSA
ncbi:MAG TPA: phage tail family protein [Anaerolineae bacterium]|nr:phage tail family protein [Anaerolineae bacterium]